MGRSLYSQAYPPTAPAIRTEPEPKADVCERWTVLNRFDPDSEDFFQDAEYEAFIDPAQLAREQAEMVVLAAAEGNSDTSESSDSGVSDQGSPMAVGSDDPAILIADAYTNRNLPWVNPDDMEMSTLSEQRWLSNSVDRDVRVLWDEPMTLEQSEEIPAFIPPASLRAPSPGIGMRRNNRRNGFDTPPDSPPQITVRRTVNITPILVEPDSALRSSEFLTAPSSRSPSPSPSEAPLFSPSPPPSVTPRFYSWQAHHVPLVPTSPTLARGNRDGPLTNPRARISFARIDSTHVPIRVTSSV
ncbi:hypothetical protein CPB84DRAFT_1797441, partial [Gymnopilus junonius]